MTIQDIEKLIKNDENRNLELKKTTGELKDGMRTACAFLNTDGGWLIFGVAPTTLKIGQFDSQNDSQNILSERQKKIVLLIGGDRRISVAMIASSLSLSEATVYREIKKINTISELYWEGPSKTGHWTGKAVDGHFDS